MIIRYESVFFSDLAIVLDDPGFLLDFHIAMTVRQVEKVSSGPYCQAGRDVQAKEPDSGFPIADDIGSNIDLWKVGDRGNGGTMAQRDLLHIEGNDGDPGFAVV